MILLSKSSAGFTELGWSAQSFSVRAFFKFIRYLALPVFICPMLYMEKYHIYSNTTHKNEALQKLLAKSEGKLKTGRGLKDLLSRVGGQFLHKYGARWVWWEKCLIFTPFILLSDRLPGAAGREMPLLMKPSAKQWGKMAHWGWLCLTRCWMRISWSKQWNISGTPSAMLLLQIYLKFLPWYPVLLSGQMIKALKSLFHVDFFPL